MSPWRSPRSQPRRETSAPGRRPFILLQDRSERSTNVSSAGCSQSRNRERSSAHRGLPPPPGSWTPTRRRTPSMRPYGLASKRSRLRTQYSGVRRMHSARGAACWRVRSGIDVPLPAFPGGRSHRCLQLSSESRPFTATGVVQVPQAGQFGCAADLPPRRAHVIRSRPCAPDPAWLALSR